LVCAQFKAGKVSLYRLKPHNALFSLLVALVVDRQANAPHLRKSCTTMTSMLNCPETPVAWQKEHWPAKTRLQASRSATDHRTPTPETCVQTEQGAQADL
jgi:hypothetical protein